MKRIALFLVLPAIVGSACGGDGDSSSGTTDGPVGSGSSLDASSHDTAPLFDTMARTDVTPDVGAVDAPAADVAVPDAAVSDAAMPDTQSPDVAPVVIGLQNATATFSQTNPGTFVISSAIDGTPGDGAGWAIHPNEGNNQTAAFETTADTPAFPSGTRIIFTLDNTYFQEHALGKFRLSYTAADRTMFADGNEGTATPGDVGAPAIWTVLVPETATASTGATLSIQLDGAVLAQDLDSTNAIYTVTAGTAATGITGFRLEVLTDPTLPHNGPGLQDSNGNFVLSQFSIKISAR